MKEDLKSFTIKLSLEEVRAISNSTSHKLDDVLKDLLLTTRSDKVKYICNVMLGKEKLKQELDSEMNDIVQTICFYMRMYKPEALGINQADNVVRELLA